MATQQDIEVALGDEWEIELSLFDAAGDPLQDVEDVRFRVARPGDLMLDLSLGDGIDLDISAAIATIIVTADMQGEVVACTADWEARAIVNGGLPIQQAFGKIWIRPSLFVQFPVT